MTKRYLDSNIFIWPLLYDDEKAKECKKIIFSLSKGEFVGCTSVLTWDEIVYILKREQGKEISLEEGKRFLKLPRLIFIDCDFAIISSAQKMTEIYNLKPRDAIHAACALRAGASEIISDDSDFDRVKEIKRVGFGKFR